MKATPIITSKNLDKKLGIIILDAKGNYYNQVKNILNNSTF